MLPSFLLPDFMSKRFQETQKRRAEARKAARARRLTECVPWDPKMPWATEVNIQAATYVLPEPLAHLEPTGTNEGFQGGFDRRFQDPAKLDAAKVAFSPEKTWAYVRRILPGEQPLSIYSGSKLGTVMFDGEVIMPCLLHRRVGGYIILMSLTPMEVFSLRVGTKLAKGHTIVAGLGMGHQLVEVMKKRSVKKVTLIEKDQELVDWLLPHILRMSDRLPPLEVVVGNAYEVMPEMTADVALLDIFDAYGNNNKRIRNRLRCPNIGKLWAWGGAAIGERPEMPWPW